MMLSGQKGNMNKNYKIQLADAYIERLIKSCIKRLSWSLILDSVARLYLFYAI